MSEQIDPQGQGVRAAMTNRPYESCGKRVTVTGWACDMCGRFFGDSGDAEHMAKWCCCSDQPCTTEGCSGRRVKPWTVCAHCRERSEAERFAAAPREEWDGETPLYCEDTDRFIFGVDDLEQHIDELADEGVKLDAIRLRICVPDNPSPFSMRDFLHLYLADDSEDLPAGWEDAESAVNRWIDAHSPLAWRAGHAVPSPESIAIYFPLEEAQQ